MKKRLRQSITGYDMPPYMSIILVNNYCDNFLKMNIIKENGAYMFNYETGVREKISIRGLSLLDKVNLIETLMDINEMNEDHMIRGESYLLEPELIYSINNRVDQGVVKLLFYPDFKEMAFSTKLCLFADRIMNDEVEERNIIGKIKEALSEDDFVRARRIIHKARKGLIESVITS